MNLQMKPELPHTSVEHVGIVKVGTKRERVTSLLSRLNIAYPNLRLTRSPSSKPLGYYNYSHQ